MTPHDDTTGDDPELQAAQDEFERHTHAMLLYIDNYIEEHNLTEDMISHVLMELCVKFRMIGYPLETEKPSASGLKLDLDRFRHVMDNSVRGAKKDSDRFIGEVKLARATRKNQVDRKSDDSGGGER